MCVASHRGTCAAGHTVGQDLGVQHAGIQAGPCLQTAAGLCVVSASHQQVKCDDRYIARAQTKKLYRSWCLASCGLSVSSHSKVLVFGN